VVVDKDNIFFDVVLVDVTVTDAAVGVISVLEIDPVVSIVGPGTGVVRQ
jgi:hypothetical protein